MARARSSGVELGGWVVAGLAGVARCRGALVVDGGPGNLPERTADFELVVRHIYAEWRAWLRARPEYAELNKRLFIAAPVSIGFALGWLFGHTVRAVPYPYERSR